MLNFKERLLNRNETMIKERISLITENGLDIMKYIDQCFDGASVISSPFSGVQKCSIYIRG